MKLLKLLFTGLFFILGLTGAFAQCVPIPTGASTTRCGPGNATVSVGAIANCSPAPYSGSVSFNWYTASTGGTLVTTTYVTSSYTGYNFTQYSTQYTKYVSVTTSYWVSVVTGGVASSRVQVTFNVNEQVTLSNLPQEFNSRCGPGPMTVMVGGPSNATFSWYTDAGATTAFATTSIPQWNNPNLTGTTTYYVSGSNGVCPPSARLAVTAKMNPELPPPATVPNQYVFGTVPVTFTASDNPYGSTVQWFATATGGTVLANGSSYTVPNPNPGNSVTYYAGSTTGTNCVSIKRTAVTATSYPIPEITPVGSPVLYSSECPMQLTSSSDYDSYEWRNSKGKVVSKEKTVTVYNPETYTLTVYVGSPKVPYVTAPYRVNLQYNTSGLPVNYVVSKQVTVAGVKDLCTLNSLDVESVQTSIAFFDGLGRPVQQVEQKASPLKKDLVQPMEYDEAGRQPKQYLPYAAATGDGSFKSDWSSAQLAFYNNTANNNADRVVNDGNPFSVAVFDDSPLLMTKKVIPEGAAWQGTEDHSIRTTLRTNTSEEVRNWIYNHGNATATGTTFYAPGQLIVSQILDEDNNPAWVYKDNTGKLVLNKRKDLETGKYLETYYVYDDFGYLRFVLPPEASANLPADFTIDYISEFTDRWLFTHKYDFRQRLTEKKVPGAAPVFFVYDSRDRMVMSQDGNQRSNAAYSWSYTKYDGYDRDVMSGTYRHGSSLSQPAMQQLFTANNASGINEKRQGNVNHGYSYSVWPNDTMNLVVQVVNYFDDYDIDNNGTPDFSYQTAGIQGEAQVYKFTRGLPTASKVKVLYPKSASNPPLEWLQTAVFYDKFNQEIQEKKNNRKALNGLTDVETRVYDFAGNITLTKQTHGVAALSITSRYQYDHGDRLTQTWRKVNNDAEVLTSQVNYNELGQPVENNLHSENNGSAFLQSVDYTYNIRGWLTHINNSTLTNDGFTNNDVNDLFGLKLGYETSEAGSIPKFNGTITFQRWKSNNPSTSRQENIYRYTYNGVNTLKKGELGVFSGGNWSFDGSFREDSIRYDLNGNIKFLVRSGENGPVMDRLTYEYEGNRLNKVTDSTRSAAGFKDGSNAVNEYAYDINGNMIADFNKGISQIVYNEQDLAEEIQLETSATQIFILYSGTGDKLQQEVLKNGKPNRKWEYIGPYVYLDGVLQYVLTSEGRIRPNGTKWKYEYDLKDHLGSVRITFDKDPATGTARVLQEDHYYPFGLNLVSLQYFYRSSSLNLMLFNGKEKEEELEWYDYGERMYDPQLGRWHVPDPMAEMRDDWSPYNYCRNNPIAIIDPTGALDGWYSDDKGVAHFDKNLNSKEDFEKAKAEGKVSGQWIGKTGIGITSDGVLMNLNEDGSKTEMAAMEGGITASSSAPKPPKWLSTAQNTLDVVGMTETPGISQAAELVSAGISAYNGDYVGAAIGLGSMVPILGKAFEAMKIARKAQKLAKAAKGGLSNSQLVRKAAQKAEAALGGKGRFAGTAKHTYANNLLSRYQRRFGDRGFRFNQYFNNNSLYGPGNRGYLDVVNHQTKSIYDYKFGNAKMGNDQFLKYSNNFPGYSINIIRP